MRETSEAESAGEAGESGLIRRLRAVLPPAKAPLVVGPGDDACVLAPPPGEQIVFTIDTLAEDVHFRKPWTSPDALGWKLMVQGLSDLASMGARPLGAVVALSLEAETLVSWFDAFLEGLLRAAEAYKAPLAGGNLARSMAGVTATAALTGSVYPGAALLRSTAKPGEAIWVTGAPGSAAAGLAWLEEDRPAEEGEAVVGKFLRPVPRLDEACFLRHAANVRCAIDLSDGVRACASLLAGESGVHAELDASRLPAGNPLDDAAKRLGRPPASLGLDGGEDFELLFTASPGAVERVRMRFEKKFGVPLTRIGRVLEGEGLEVLGDPGEEAFEHF